MSDYYTREEVDELIQKAKSAAVEEALRALPHVVKNLVTAISGLQAASEQFYNNNKDLTGHKELVRKVMMDVESKNPGASIETILQKTAETTRTRIKQGGNLNTQDRGSTPSANQLSDSFNKVLEDMK